MLKLTNKTIIPIAYAILKPLGDGFDIIYIRTHPKHRKKSLATHLLKNFTTKFPNATLTLEVRESNLPAMNLYKKLNFNEIATRKNYYKNGETAIIMQK